MLELGQKNEDGLNVLNQQERTTGDTAVVMRLLLVDDEEQFLRATRILFENRGVETFVADSGEAALKILSERPVDVVILDLKMPGMNGLTTLQRIKQEYPLVEIILLTGQATVESAMEGLKLGAFDYEMKPATIADLLNKAREAFEKKLAIEEKTSAGVKAELQAP